MKLIVFGANGGIGRHVVEQGLAAGHQATAVARRPESITSQHANLTIKPGDVLDPASIAPLLAGQEAVVSALGVHSRAPTVVYSQGVANILQAMQAAGVRRMLCISATGLDPGQWLQHYIAKPLLWTILREMYTDLTRMEDIVKRSPVDWTIIRPPQLTDKPRTGRYQIACNEHLPAAWSLSRADVADYIVRHLTDAGSYQSWVEIAY